MCLHPRWVVGAGRAACFRDEPTFAGIRLPPAPAPQSPAPELPTGLGGWQDRAACRGIASSVFFSPDSERGQARARRESNARPICRACPVLTQCRERALTTGEPYGIWGGMTERERRQQARQLRRDEHRSVPPEPARPRPLAAAR